MKRILVASAVLAICPGALACGRERDEPRTPVAQAKDERVFEACLPYETTVVELAGRVERETFPGRPDYESTEKGDEPETYWVLHFSRPVCVREMRPLYHASSTNVTRMQLMLSPGQYDTYGALVGQRVVASGTLMRWITGHHHTPVLLQVQGLRAATAADTLP